MQSVEVCCVLSSVMINFDEIYPYSGGTTCEVKIHSEMSATRALWTYMLKGHGSPSGSPDTFCSFPNNHTSL